MSQAPDINKILKEQNQKIDEQSHEIKKLTGLVYTLVKTFEAQPKYISLATLCHDMNIKRQTLYAHILNNYEPDVDFVKDSMKFGYGLNIG